MKTFGIIGLALALIIGNASSNLVNSVVQDMFSPFIGLFLPSGSLGNMNVNMTSISGQVSEFRYGDLMLKMIDFVIILFLMFIVYKELSRMKLVDDKTLTDDRK
jgi:large conductance mechanosensitive channel